jgi:hypothetical protein
MAERLREVPKREAWYTIFMDEIIVSQTPDIKSLILTVRDTQVLLDSDVTMLYGYETRAINQAASRNRERFPDKYRFQLTKDEYERHCSKSQSVTLNVARGQNLKNYLLHTANMA